jgi:hypothetical protein
VKLGSRGKPVITGIVERLISEMVPRAGTFPGYLEFIRLAGLIAKYHAQQKVFPWQYPRQFPPISPICAGFHGL